MKTMIFSILFAMLTTSAAHASLTRIPESKTDSFRRAATDAIEDTKLKCHQSGRKDSAATKVEYLTMLVNKQQPLMNHQDVFVDDSTSKVEVIFKAQNSIERSTVTVTMNEDRTKIDSTKVIVESTKSVNHGDLANPKIKEEWRTSYTMDCGETL